MKTNIDMVAREKSLGRYVLTLDPIRRHAFLNRMAPPLRKRVEEYAASHRANEVHNWEEMTQRLYIKSLKKKGINHLNDFLNRCSIKRAELYRSYLTN